MYVYVDFEFYEAANVHSGRDIGWLCTNVP